MTNLWNRICGACQCNSIVFFLQYLSYYKSIKYSNDENNQELSYIFSARYFFVQGKSDVILLHKHTWLLIVQAENDTLVFEEEEVSTRSVEGVLDHVVIYQPLPPAPEYRSSEAWDPRGMEYVYLIVNTFLDLILRQDVLPKSEY